MPMTPREKKVLNERIFTAVVLMVLAGVAYGGIYGFKHLFAKAEEQVDADAEAMVRNRQGREQLRKTYINQANKDSYEQAKARGDKYYIHISQ